MRNSTNACRNCKNLVKVTESWELSHIWWWECWAKPSVINLKSFPFQKTKCEAFLEKTKDVDR